MLQPQHPVHALDLNSDNLNRQLENIRKLEGHLTFRLARMSKLLDAQASGLLEGTGVNLTGYRMMMIISIFGAITISDLSRVMMMDRAQISRAGTDLVAGGLVAYRAVPGNRRKKALTLTAKGSAMMGRLRAVFDRRQERLEDILGADDLAALWRVIEKFSAALADGGVALRD